MCDKSCICSRCGSKLASPARKYLPPASFPPFAPDDFLEAVVIGDSEYTQDLLDECPDEEIRDYCVHMPVQLGIRLCTYPIELAITFLRFDVASLLVEQKANINYRCCNNETLLHRLARGRDAIASTQGLVCKAVF